MPNFNEFGGYWEISCMKNVSCSRALNSQLCMCVYLKDIIRWDFKQANYKHFYLNTSISNLKVLIQFDGKGTSVNFKGTFWCHRLDQNTNKNFLRNSALASKKRSHQKNKCAFIFNRINKNKVLHNSIFFWFGPFVEARADILKKIHGILVQTMTPKSPFEINWPLACNFVMKCGLDFIFLTIFGTVRFQNIFPPVHVSATHFFWYLKYPLL